MSNYNNQYFMYRPLCDHLARKLSFGYLARNNNQKKIQAVNKKNITYKIDGRIYNEI